jgi:hypothetical protein
MSNQYIPSELINAILEDSRDKLQRIPLRWSMSNKRKDIIDLADDIASIIYDVASEHLEVAEEAKDI